MKHGLSPSIETEGAAADSPTEIGLLSSDEGDKDQLTVRASAPKRPFTSEERHMMRGWIRNEEKLSGHTITGLGPWRRFVDTHQSTLRPIRTPASYYFYYRSHLELAPPIVPGGSSRVEKTEAEEHPLFNQGPNPMKFWIHPTAEVDITILSSTIQRHGGLVFERDSQADFAVVRRIRNVLNKSEYDQLLKNCKGGIVGPHWIRNCIKQNKILGIRGVYKYPETYVDNDDDLSDVVSVPPSIGRNPDESDDSQINTLPTRKRPPRPQYTLEEKHLMRKIGREVSKKGKAFHPKSRETWRPYIDLFPGRSANALAHYALRSPNIFRDTSTPASNLETNDQHAQKSKSIEAPHAPHPKSLSGSNTAEDGPTEPASKRAKLLRKQYNATNPSSSTHPSIDSNSAHQGPLNSPNENHHLAFSVSTADFEVLVSHIMISRPSPDSHDAISKSLSILANSEEGGHHPDTWWLAVYYMDADLFRQLSQRLRFDRKVTS